jgi:arsenite methyltransferase
MSGTPLRDPLRVEIQAHYTERLTAPGTCCAPRPTLPEAIPSFGCGDPAAHAQLRTGERVLDLGSGAGLDAFRAAEAVGPGGTVIGVDMTPAMLDRARAGAARLGLAGVSFREGFIEALPVDDESIDVVLSNCVINLSTEKARVFGEIARVLAPGGRLRVSDILVHGAHLAAPTDEGWCTCVDGAVDAATYRELAERAGLVDVAVEPGSPPVPPGSTYAATIIARKAVIERADEAARRTGAELLSAARLPLEGWFDEATDAFVAREGGSVVGTVAIERRSGERLLRSLTVSEALRGRGFGRALLAFAVRLTEREGGGRVYALTTTIAPWLERLGFTAITRADLPAALHASDELRGACPASAQVFALDVAPSTSMLERRALDVDGVTP